MILHFRSRSFTTIAQQAIVAAGLAGLMLSALAGQSASAASRATTRGHPPVGTARDTADHPAPAAMRAAARVATRRLAADASAVFRAHASGRPVVVTANTTETSLTVARPNGSLATTIHALPVRVYAGGHWRPVTTTLHRDPGGGYSPVTPSSLILSSGGGPLAVLAYPGGGTLRIGNPGRLPAPVITAATATYALRPGVRLQVTAGQAGGITLNLLLTRTHGRLPAGLSLPLAAHGLTVSAGSRKGIAAVDGQGVAEFTGPAPEAFVTATTGARARAVAAMSLTSRSITLRLARSPARAAAARITAVLASDPTVCTADASSGIACTKLDPKTTTVGYTDIGQSCQQPTWNASSPSLLAIGNNVYGGGCSGPARAEFAFDTTSLTTDMKIQTATLDVAEPQGSDLGCTNTWPAFLHWVSGVSSSTSWSSMPKDLNNGSPIRSAEIKPGGCGSNGTVDISYSVWDQVVASKGEPTLDLEIRGAELPGNGDPAGLQSGPCGDGYTSSGLSSNGYNCGWMHLANNPSITTVYDLVPASPADLDTTPPAHSITNSDAGCVGANGPLPWIGKTDGAAMDLHASIYAKLSAEAVRAKYAVNDLTGNTSLDAGFDFNEQNTGDYSHFYGVNSQSSQAVTDTAIDFPGGHPADGHVYDWSAQAEVTGVPIYNDSQNGPQTAYDSAATGPCFFGVDETSPNPPTSITSSAFPATGGSTEAGGSGTFTFSGATDPDPCQVCLASGLYGYAYALNPVGGITTSTPITTSGTTPSIRVNTWGANALWVESVDNAGNYSQPVIYHFFVPANLISAKMPGDVNGDSVPDLLGVTKTSLSIYPGPVTTSLPAAAAGTSPGQSPDNSDDWGDFQITHRGSYSQNPGYDDLVAHVNNSSDPRSAKLYFYTNGLVPDSATVPFGNSANNVSVLTTHPVCVSTAENLNCAHYPGGTANPNNTNWSHVTQILEPGDAWAGTATDNRCGSTDSRTPGTPSLLAVENDQLWLYMGGCGDNLTSASPYVPPVELGSSGWGNMTLIAPGMINGQLTLWARDNTSGNLYSYTFTTDANGVPTLSNPGQGGTGSPIPAEGSGSTATPIPLKTSLKAVGYPAIASNGDDATGSTPSLYTIDTSGNVWEFAGTTGTSSDSSPLNPDKTQIGTVPANSITQLS